MHSPCQIAAVLALDLGAGSRVYGVFMKKQTVAFAIMTLLSSASLAAQHSAMPPGMSHEEHLRQLKDAELKQRGALAMGFDQDQTAHHFLLQVSGGAIVVRAKDANDTAIVAQIRLHLRDIAAQFAGGAFDKPIETHAELPPGAAVMAANKKLIVYRYEERPDGAGVLMETADAETRKAIHDFLRYQIVEHKTGDPLTGPRLTPIRRR